MIKNYIKITLRNLVKRKTYSLINIVGLAFGITCFLLISLYLQNELSYDKYFKDSDKIYRVLRVGENESGKYDIGYTSGPYANALLNDYPSLIESATRVIKDNGLVEYDDKIFRESNIFFADSNFLDFFNYPLVEGNENSILRYPNDIIISADMVEKYFGNLDPLGKIIRIDKRFDFKVTGIFDNRNINSHLKFDFLGSIELFENFDWFSDWWNNSLSTYIKIADPGYKDKLIADFPNFMDKYFAPDFERTGKKIGLTLEPLKDVYFNDNVLFDFVEHGNKASVYIFSIIAFFILIIACINFMNLSIAISARRSKEAGIRKVVGAEKKNISYQFIGEAILFAGISFLISLVLLKLALPYFNSFIGKHLIITYNFIDLLLISFLFIAAVGIISGGYPALKLSSVEPIKVLTKSDFSLKNKKNKFGQFLVITQFAISVMLIIGTIIISNQMNYMSDKKLGFNKDHIIVMNIDNRNFRNNIQQFKDDLQRNPKIVSATAMSGEPGGYHDRYSYKIAEKGGEYFSMRSLFCDENYIKTFGIKIIAGRDFSKRYSTDKTNAIILNETAVKSLGYTPSEAIGKSVSINLVDSTYRKIIGVVQDYNFTSLKNKIEPLAIAIRPDYRKLAIKINGNDVKGTLKEIERVYAEISPGYPFEYQFLDANFDKLYKSEIDAQILFRDFSIVAIIIACLGLLGLAMYSAETRTKEIGIRKVLGASVPNIISLISKEFLVLVLIANLIAIPVSFYLLNKWLENFAYRIEISWWVFVLSGGIALMIAFITVSFQALKAAAANPVDSLKYE